MLRSNYAYAAGKIRFLENKLLNETDIERMLEAKDAQAVFKVFNDTNYADELQDIQNPAEFRTILDHDLKQTKDLIKAICPNKRLLDFFFLRYDFHNIKLFFKAKYLNKDLSEFESHLGMLDVALLREAIINDSAPDFSPKIDEIIEKLNKDFTEDHAPQVIDSLCDKEYFMLLKETADHLKNSFIKELAEFETDVANLKQFLRLKNLGKPVNLLTRYFIPSGRVKQNDYLSAFEAEADIGGSFILRHFSNSELDRAVKAFQENKNLEELEIALDNVVTAHTRKAKYLAFGPEVLIQYFYSKINAQRNVRIIMVGKINEMPADEIATRLRAIV